MEVHPRIEHGQGNTNMAYSQRNPTHRPNHSQGGHPPVPDIYKPSRSPSAARYSAAYPGGGQQQQQQQNAQSAAGQGAASVVVPPSSVNLHNQVLQQQQQRYVGGQGQGHMPPAQPQLLYRDFSAFYRQNRISLLHSDYAARSRELQGVVIDDGMGGQQPLKKIRLSDKDPVQPLRIETRDQPGAYNPQVEAISPTLPDHVQQEDQQFRTTKDELIQQIGKVDREIAKAESSIAILKKKEQELEEIANKPSVKGEVEEDTQPKHQSLHQKIYAENRKRAQNAHAKLDTLGPKVEFPLYNQPSDTSVYHENKRKHIAFKGRLIEYFKKRHVEKENRNNYLAETYSKLMQEWLRKVDKIESSSKRKGKEAKNRDFFEKVFPELRKQREDKERFSRFNRVGSRVKSEADLEEIMDNLQEQAMEDKKMRSYAVIPPILLDAKERKIKYEDDNGHVEDMEAVYKERKFLNVWTPQEKEVFKEKFLQHPKNFVVIASYLDRKSVSDCVQHYYLSKKTENYKQLLRKSRQRTRSSRNNTQKVNNAANASVVDILTTGVTTRLQREQQQKTGVTSRNSATPASAASAAAAASSSSVPGSAAAGNEAATSNDAAAARSPTPTTSSAANSTVVVKTEPVDDTKVFKDFNSYEDYRNKTFFGAEDSKEKIKEELKTESTTDVASDQNMPGQITENKKKKERRKEENTAMETSDEEAGSAQDKQIGGSCAVCQSQLGAQLQSRPLPPSHASQYGLREEQVPAHARVCNTCRCKCVRSRYTHCPLPNCPNSRNRVKRLRSFPYRLQDLSSDVRDSILADFLVPSGVTKCCSACFNRIQRRLGPVEDWSEQEIAELKSALTDLGANWQLVAERLNKMPPVVKSYYAANRKRLQLESCLGDRKPTLTDEEESGSSTSSCEEPPNRDRHSSDTASAAESPPVLTGNGQPTNVKKEDYDSSATETADEAVTPDTYQGSATITAVGAAPCDPSSSSSSAAAAARANASPLSVKDLVLNVIESQLKKNPGSRDANPTPPTSVVIPTISSILNSTDSNDVTIVSEYSLGGQQQQQQQQAAGRNARQDLNLAKLKPLIGATITPVSGPIVPSAPPEPVATGRDDLVVLQVNDGGRLEPETLDLSIKKPREMHVSSAQKMLGNSQQVQHTQLHIPSGVGYGVPQDRKSPFGAQAPGGMRLHVSGGGQGGGGGAKMPSPKPANPKAGSITQGTPIVTQPRYGLLRHVAPDSKMGSITQGTPIHLPHNSMQDKQQRVYEYYKRPPSQGPPSGGPQGQSYGQGQPPPPQSQYREQLGYTVDQHMSSRQIIMNDFITSQHMQGRGREKIQYYPSSPHRTPPPQQQQQQQQPPPQQQQQQQQQGGQQQRQGVIQRHTRPPYLPPGHEALSSLVDVAVQQPSLPVPTAPHEGLGKTIAEQLEQPHRFQLLQQQQQQQLLRREQQQRSEEQHRRVEYHRQQVNHHAHQVNRGQQQQQQQQRGDTNTLTAASLIDAIITHQINQSVDGGRENSAATDRKGDVLFQGFNRDQQQQQQQQQQQENRPPSVISVDLDAPDGVSKNLTVKELTDTVISRDFSSRSGFYNMQQQQENEWKRRMQHKAAEEQQKRSNTPQQHLAQGNDERQIIRIAQPSVKYHVEPVSPPENNHHHWNETTNYRRYQTAPPQSHMSPLDYVKNRIAEVMRTEDDKKEITAQQEKDRDSPGDMVIDEDKSDDFINPATAQQQYYGYVAQQQQQQQNQDGNAQQQQQSNDARSNEPKPLLSAQYEPLSDED
ncbi:unnamed protein product [Brassicogethes aeneus]|uniref:SANT domain-containing protein n=1 Tax=Brassicogethes aeneus TaxID=1431903 RepID=A0A9P0AUY9_BRAAE|nr:unnamed protein product [Brassicogethes aeneus]